MICPTLAHENEAVHATLRHLAQGLAERGFCALRLDYDGTGDSAGRQQGPGRVAAWLSSVTEAIALLRNGGVRSVMVVGVRFGALMAALAAEQDGDIEGLVLWDPVVSGRAYLAEQRMLSARSFNTPSSRKNGSVEVPGMLLEATMVADMRALNLSLGKGGLARRVLVLTRPERGPEALASRLDAPHVEWAETPGQADLIERGSVAGIVAYDTSKAVVDWVSRVSASEASPVNLPSATSGATVGWTPAGAPIIETPTFLAQQACSGS